MLEPGKNETSNFQELLRSEQIPFEESTCQGHNIPIFHFCSRSASSSGCRQGSSQRKTQPKRPRCCILSPAYWEIRMVWNNERENVLQFFFLLLRNLYMSYPIYSILVKHSIQNHPNLHLSHSSKFIHSDVWVITWDTARPITLEGTRWNDKSFTKITATGHRSIEIWQNPSAKPSGHIFSFITKSVKGLLEVVNMSI